MLEDRFYDLCRQNFPFRVLVHANYEAKETLIAKGITPAIFLTPFYVQKGLYSMEIQYGNKEKSFKPMPQIAPIDYDEYEKYSEEVVNQSIKKTISESQSKNPKNVDKSLFESRQKVQNYLNNINFHWFEKAVKEFYYSLTLSEDNYKKSTLQQPKGLAFVIEVELVVNNKSAKENYQKLRREVDNLVKRMYYLNPLHIKSLPVLIVLLYDNRKEHTNYHAAKAYSEQLKSEYRIETTLHSKVQLHNESATEIALWSNHPRPVFHYSYKLTASDNLKILTADGMNNLTDTVNIHKERMKKSIESRLEYLMKRYDDHYSMGSKIFGFFKASTPKEKHLVTEEAEAREIADFMFVLEDYKRAYDAYRTVLKEFDKRDANIEASLKFMLNICYEMSKFHSIKLKDSSPHSVLGRQIEELETYDRMGRTELTKYLVFVLYFMHTFKLFDPFLTKQKFLPSVKRCMVMHDDNRSHSDKKMTPFLIPLLIYEQYSNINLLYQNIDFRRYCYDTVRVSMKYAEYKLFSHGLRGLQIVENIYSKTFPGMYKYVNIHLSQAYVQSGFYEEGLKSIKKAWNVLAEVEFSEEVLLEENEFRKMLANSSKIINDIMKQAPETLQQISKDEVLFIPEILGVDIVLSGEGDLRQVDRTGKSWSEIADNFNENTEIYSEGYNKNSMEKVFKVYDCGNGGSFSGEEKQLIYRCKAPVLNPLFIAKNSRTSYLGEPIKVIFSLHNPFISEIHIHDLTLLVSTKDAPKFEIKKNQFHQKLTFKPEYKKVDIVFEIIPQEQGLLQIQGMEWSFERMRLRHKIRGFRDTQELQKPFYYTIKVQKQKGKLEITEELQQQLCQGQITTKAVKLKNIGQEEIDSIYIAYGSDSFYGKKYEKLDCRLAVGEEKQLSLPMKIPLVPHHISKDWRLMDKKIFLYRTVGQFRVNRSVITTIVNKLLFQEITCEKLSTHLHLLTYSFSKSNSRSGLIKTLIIKKGYEISKVDISDLDHTCVYYFFLKRSDRAVLECFNFSTGVTVNNLRNVNGGAGYETLLETGYEKQISFTENQIDLVFGWSCEPGRNGLIDINALHVTPLKEQVLPFLFYWSLPYNIAHDFSQNPVLEVPIEVRIKNIFSKKSIKIWVYFSEQDTLKGLFWEGITERNFTLSQNEQFSFNISIVVSRQGVYNLSECLNYIVEGEKKALNITHSQHENIYFHVVDSSDSEKLKKNPENELLENVLPNLSNVTSDDGERKDQQSSRQQSVAFTLQEGENSNINILSSPRNTNPMSEDSSPNPSKRRESQNLLDL